VAARVFFRGSLLGIMGLADLLGRQDQKVIIARKRF
jgi:hypothetical protein